MALELISSGFKPSTAPPAVILECRWEREGVTAYSFILATPDEINRETFWLGLQEGVERWFTVRKRKNGECYVH